MTQESDTQSPAAGELQEVDVAIFGAGPAGLCTALALHKACPQLKVHVFERARKTRPSGGSIGLFSKNVFTAFEALGSNVARAVQEAGITRRNFITADHDGSNRVERHVPSSVIAWYELQQALLSCMPSPDMVSLGCEVAEIKEDGSDVMVATLSNGNCVRAKLIVGADGNGSACGKYIQGDTKAAYVGAAAWRMFLPGENPFVEVSDSLVLTGDCKTLVMQPVKRDGKVLTYVAGLSGFDEDRLHELNQTRYIQAVEEDTQQLQAKLERFREAMKLFKPEMLDYVMANAVPESVLEHPMFSLDPCNDWVRGRVVLVGDAAHVMPPNIGQGTPMAVEDAVQLASSLLHHGGITSSALSNYESVRKERVTPIWEESTRQAVAYYKQRSSEDNPMKISTKVSGKDAVSLIMSYQAPPLELAREPAAVA